MRPIIFECTAVIPSPATEICVEIATVARWSEFKGYGVLPGIASAHYEHKTSDMLGSRIRVQNTDGSGHVEEIVAWQLGEKVSMKLYEFTPPLNRLASHFIEEWSFSPVNNGTLVERNFQLFAKQPATRPLLWLISLLFKRAIARHLTQMSEASKVHKELL
jgi:hypothetical protein